MTDSGHRGEGEHDQRHVAMPAMPRAGFIVIEPKFILGGLKGRDGEHAAPAAHAPRKSCHSHEDKVDGGQLGARPLSEDQRSVVGGHLDHFAQNETRFFTVAFKIGDIAHAPGWVSRLKGHLECCV